MKQRLDEFQTDVDELTESSYYTSSHLKIVYYNEDCLLELAKTLKVERGKLEVIVNTFDFALYGSILSLISTLNELIRTHK